MKFKRTNGSATTRHLTIKDGESEELRIDSYRGSADDGEDYQFVIMAPSSGLFGLTRRQARKLARAILKEEGK